MQEEKSPRAILRYVGFVLFKRKWLVIILFFFTLFSFVFGTFLITPQWEATTKLLVLQNPKQQMILFNDLVAPTPANKDVANDLVEILTSTAFATEIVKQYKLDERERERAQNPRTLRDKAKLFLVKVFTSPFLLAEKLGLREAKPPNFFAQAVEDFLEDMEDIALEEGTSTITLSIWADSPQLAVDIANTMASMLIDKVKQFDRSEATRTYEFARAHLQSVKDALEKAEEELVAFKERENIVALDTEKTLKLQRWDALTSELSARKKDLLALKTKLQALRTQLSSQPPRITTAETTGTNAIYEKLKEDLNAAEMSLADLQKDLEPKHPDILGLQARIALNKQKLQEEAKRILLSETTALNPLYQDLESQILNTEASLAEVQSKVRSLQAELANLEEELATIARKETELERLTRSVAGLKDRYLTLRQKLLELEVQRFTEISEFDIKVSDPAFIPEGTEPDWPIWILNVLIGMVVGLSFSVGLAFFLEYWSDTLHAPEEVHEAIGVKVIGVVPPVSFPTRNGGPLQRPQKVGEQVGNTVGKA